MSFATPYIDTPMKTPKAKNVAKTTKNNAIKALDELGTATLLWALVKRHKFAIVFSLLILENVYMFLHFFTVI